MHSPDRQIRPSITDQYALHFVTFTAVSWTDVFTRQQYRDMIIESLRFYSQEKGLRIYAYVIMSNHIHLIVSAARDSTGLSSLIRDFKGYTSKQITSHVETNKRESRRRWMTNLFKFHGTRNPRNKHVQFWRQDNYPSQLTDHSSISRVLHYIHYNPVKAGIVLQPKEYIYSSSKTYHNLPGSPLEVTILDIPTQRQILQADSTRPPEEKTRKNLRLHPRRKEQKPD